MEPTDPTEPDDLDTETNVALNAQVIAYNGNNLGGASGPEKLFDGAMTDLNTDKWVWMGKTCGWLSTSARRRTWGRQFCTTQAQTMNPPPPPGAINTAAYELYALNTEKISVEELLAKTYEERTTLLADQAYWTLLASRTNNLEDITEDELDASGARIFKINVSDTDSTGWGDCVPDLRAGALRLQGSSQV